MLSKLLSALFGAAKQNRKQLFTAVIDPLFTEVQPVLDDYLALFRTVSGMLVRSEAHSADEIAATLKERRAGMWMARVKVCGIAAALRSSARNQDVAQLAEEIERLFSTADGDGTENEMPCQVLLSDLEGGVLTPDARQRVAQMAEATLQELEGLWASITRNYGSLRVRFLAPSVSNRSALRKST